MSVEPPSLRLGSTRMGGTLTYWVAADGDAVRTGDAIGLIVSGAQETEIEAPADGFLRIKARAGRTYAAGTVVCEVVQEPAHAVVEGTFPT